MSGFHAATTGGSSQDNLTAATRGFDLVVSPGTWRFQQTTLSFLRRLFLSGNFSFFDNRPAATVTVQTGGTMNVDLPIALGEVTLTMSVAGGGC